VSGAVRQWIRHERDHRVRAELESQGYVLDWLLVYRSPFETRLTATILPPARRSSYLRSAARGSARRLHAERIARMSS
jgi:hypothetical protein